MRQSQTALAKASIRGYRVIALLLSLVCTPAIAASGIDPLCDGTADRSDSVELAAEEFSIEVVEHGGNADVDEFGAIEDALSALRPTNPSVDTILRRIFDESTTIDVAAPESAADIRATAAPLVELTVPEAIEAPTDAVESAESDSAVEQNSGNVEPEFPGLTDADSRRYRRQMYRTDI